MRHPLRTYTPSAGTSKDVDQAARTQLIRAFVLSLSGLLLGGLAGALGVGAAGWGVRTAVLVTGGAWAIAFFVPLVVSALGGRAAGTIHNPSGRSTPSRREYSLAESLLARGLTREAVDAFEVAVAEDPTDPTPYLRIARIQRDRLGDFHEAARWFRRVLGDATVSPGTAFLATRELVELYQTKLDEPARAAPLLARLAEERSGAPEGEWAAEELARVKATIREREEG